MASIEDRGTRAYVPSYEIAKVYLALGHSDDAVSRERGDRSKVALYSERSAEGAQSRNRDRNVRGATLFGRPDSSTRFARSE